MWLRVQVLALGSSGFEFCLASAITRAVTLSRSLNLSESHCLHMQIQMIPVPPLHKVALKILGHDVCETLSPSPGTL